MSEQTASMRPATDRRALSTVAYGSNASKPCSRQVASSSPRRAGPTLGHPRLRRSVGRGPHPEITKVIASRKTGP